MVTYLNWQQLKILKWNDEIFVLEILHLFIGYLVKSVILHYWGFIENVWSNGKHSSL